MATRHQDGIETRETGDACRVVVLYEDLPARDTALQIRDRLVQKFMGDLDFGFDWWRIEFLADPEIAREAAGIANAADLILVALSRSEEVGLTVKAWLDACLSQRSLADGALGVIRISSSEGNQISNQDAIFRAVASRANLDYLPLSVAPSPPMTLGRLREDDAHPTPQGWADMPDHRHRSSGWGLNE